MRAMQSKQQTIRNQAKKSSKQIRMSQIAVLLKLRSTTVQDWRCMYDDVRFYSF